MNANSDTKFVVTIDTETYAVNGSPLPFDLNIYGRSRGADLGVAKIMEICDQYNVKATFFVDVYMHHYYGKLRVKELCQRIDRGGHDVQLHAHTSWLPGSKSGSLHSFSLARQVEIIGEGRDLIGEWIGKSPVAFRAGAYTANQDTIRALERNGFSVDSSYFPFHRNCALSRELRNTYGNRTFRVGDILEVPVTTYWLLNTPYFRKLSKVDINSCSLAEMSDVIPKLIKNQTPYVVLFLHSFSFIKWNRNFSSASPNTRALNRFEEVLDSIANGRQATTFCTMGDIAKIGPGPAGDQTNGCCIPELSSSRLFARAIRRLLG